MRARRFLTLLTILLSALASAGEPLTVAVASNFRQTAQALASRYESETGTEVRLSSGSTGALYARINNGAPYDVLLAADAARPALLAESGLGVAATRATYAIGTLVVWSRAPELVGADCRRALGESTDGRIAIANPEIAPYGKAAVQFLENAGILTTVGPSLALGENVSQALQFAATGNARFGVVASALLQSPALPDASCSWAVPADLHDPIEQQMIVLSDAANPKAAVRFAEFLGSDTARSIIAAAGYRLP